MAASARARARARSARARARTRAKAIEREQGFWQEDLHFEWSVWSPYTAIDFGLVAWQELVKQARGVGVCLAIKARQRHHPGLWRQLIVRTKEAKLTRRWIGKVLDLADDVGLDTTKFATPFVLKRGHADVLTWDSMQLYTRSGLRDRN